MVKVPEKIIDKLKKFIAYLESSNIHIEKAILFGSYSRGTQTKWSDIDIALVSNDFEGLRYYDLDKLTEACFAIDTDISPHPFRPEDFTPDNLFVKEILRTGIVFA